MRDLDPAIWERDHTVLPLVYFVSADRKSHPVKIGRSTTAAINDRLSSLQTGTPFRLRFMLVIEAPAFTETEIHRALSSSRLEGEWFRRNKKLLDFMAALEDDNPDWRELLGPRYMLTELGEQKAREAEALERYRLNELREAMNAADAHYRPRTPLPA